jgi:hypothetical protein
MTGGWVVQYVSTSLHWELLDAYRLIFFGYAAAGMVKLTLALLLSSAVEADEKTPPAQKTARSNGAGTTETAPLLGGGNDSGNANANANANANGHSQASEQLEGRSRFAALLPDISKEGYAIMTSLCIFFALDAFASGLASM